MIFLCFYLLGVPCFNILVFRIILGSCVCDAMNDNRGSLLTTSTLVDKHSIIKKGSVGC